jgi:hypothetical protein
MADRYCRNCGHELQDDDRFCPSCGRPAHETAHVPTPEADVPVPSPGNFDTGGFAPQAGTPPPSRSAAGKLFIGCAGAVVLLVLFVGCLAVLGQGTGGESVDGNPSAERAAQQPPEEEEPPPEEEEPPPEEEQARVYSVGEEVQVGDVAYTVTKARPTQELTDRYGISPPKTGNFIVVNFLFANKGEGPVNVSGIGMYLYDSQGRQFETESDTFGYIPEDKDIFLLDRINPGMSREAQVIYSVPPDASGFELEVTSGFWQSEVARISLGL